MDELRRAASNQFVKTPFERLLSEITNDENFYGYRQEYKKIAISSKNGEFMAPILNQIWKRINRKEKNPHKLLKTLLLIEYLIAYGDPNFCTYLSTDIDNFKYTLDYDEIEEKHGNKGKIIRDKTRIIIDIVRNEDKRKLFVASKLEEEKKFASNQSNDTTAKQGVLGEVLENFSEGFVMMGRDLKEAGSHLKKAIMSFVADDSTTKEKSEISYPDMGNYDNYYSYSKVSKEEFETRTKTQEEITKMSKNEKPEYNYDENKEIEEQQIYQKKILEDSKPIKKLRKPGEKIPEKINKDNKKFGILDLNENKRDNDLIDLNADSFETFEIAKSFRNKLPIYLENELNLPFDEFVDQIFVIMRVWRKIQMKANIIHEFFVILLDFKKAYSDYFVLTNAHHQLFIENLELLDLENLDLVMEIFEFKIEDEKMLSFCKNLNVNCKFMDLALLLVKNSKLKSGLDLIEILSAMVHKQAFSEAEILVKNFTELQKEYINMLVEKKDIKRATHFLKENKIDPSSHPELQHSIYKNCFGYYYRSFDWEKAEEKFIGSPKMLALLIEKLWEVNKIDVAHSIFKRHKLKREDFISGSNLFEKLADLEKTSFKKIKKVNNYILDKDGFLPSEMVFNPFEKDDYLCLNELGVNEEDVFFIDSSNEKNFDEAFIYLNNESIIGLDSEFMQNFSALEEEGVAIFQISGEKKTYIFDVYKMENVAKFFDRFFDLLENKNIIKVGHTFGSDLEQLRLSLLKIKRPLDVKIENYYDLVDIFKTIEPSSRRTALFYISEYIFSKKLSKMEQFSNWERRPLRKAQLHYAAMDALVCVKLFKAFEIRLKEKNKDIYTLKTNFTSTSPTSEKPREPREAREKESKGSKPKELKKGNFDSERYFPRLKPSKDKKGTIENEEIEGNFSCSKEYEHFYKNKSEKNVKFIMDNMMNRLAKFFRNLGVDTECLKEKDYEKIEYIAKNEERIIVTKDQRLMARKHGLPVFMPHSQNVDEQFEEIKNFFNYSFTNCSILSRCSKCNNSQIEIIANEDAKKHLNWNNENEFNKIDIYFQCAKCKQVYWEGSTWRKSKKRFESVTTKEEGEKEEKKE